MKLIYILFALVSVFGYFLYFNDDYSFEKNKKQIINDSVIRIASAHAEIDIH